MKSNLLKAARVKMGLSQGDCAAALNMTRTNYRNKENGRLGFSLDQVSILMNLLNLSPTEVVEIFLTSPVNTNVNISA